MIENGLHFGDKLKYISPIIQGLETPCVFVRDDDGKAVVLFQSAEWVARVNYHLLYREGDS